MTSNDRRAREKAEVQEKILSAARDLFVERGYEAVTMRAIAEAIEYTPGALYAHFKDKADLVRALCGHDFAAFDAHLCQLQASEAHPLAKICRMGQAYIDFAASHPRQYEFMFMTKLPAAPAGAEPQGEPEKSGYHFLVECVGQAIEMGLLRKDLTDKWLGAQLLWAGLHGIAAVSITFAGDPNHQRLAEVHAAGRAMRQTLMLGMARDPGHVAALMAAEDGGPGALTAVAAAKGGRS